MTLGATGILDRVVSHALATGLFERVNQYEPTSTPGTGMTCAVWVDTIATDPRASGLDTANALLVVKVRIYAHMSQDPPDAIDPQVSDAVDVLWTAYIGDFTLGDTIRAVDVMGMSGTKLTAQAGYVAVGEGPQLRVMTITLPLLINDVWTESA